MTDDIDHDIQEVEEQIARLTDRKILLKLRPMIVGICGPKGTGKDTTATELTPWFYHREIETNIAWFADPLYEMVATLTTVPVHVLRNQKYKNAIWTGTTAPIKTLIGKSPRELL